ncbi:MAG: ribosome silencing factor [Bryobacteraceae bacterium]
MPEKEPPIAPVIAAQAAESKKALDVRVLDLRGVSSFTDYFVICSGANIRQIQAISDEVEERLEKHGERPLGIEGYERAEWILADYGDFIVHIFSQPAREFYDLERLWRSASQLTIDSSSH